MVYMKVVKSKSKSSHKEKMFAFYCIYMYEMMEANSTICSKHFIINV